MRGLKHAVGREIKKFEHSDPDGPPPGGAEAHRNQIVPRLGEGLVQFCSTAGRLRRTGPFELATMAIRLGS